MNNKIPSVWLGISIGALVSIVFGWAYLVVLREPGSAFYPFAGLVFLAGPLIGGIVAMLKKQENRGKAFFTSGHKKEAIIGGFSREKEVTPTRLERVTRALRVPCSAN